MLYGVAYVQKFSSVKDSFNQTVATLPFLLFLAEYKACTDVQVDKTSDRYSSAPSGAKRDLDILPNAWYKFEGPNGKARKVMVKKDGIDVYSLIHV